MFDVPEPERADRVDDSDDLCVIRPSADDTNGRTDYWIRAVLEIPIHEVVEPFTWGVWVSQSEESFRRYAATFNQDQSEDSSFGWLLVPMRHYRDADGSWPSLECDVHWGSVGARPTVVLWQSDHQLSIDQQNGINWEKAISIATELMHG